MQSPTQYTLQLRLIGTEDARGGSELEIVARPSQQGQHFHGRFLHWEPVFEKICSWVSSSSFHRKAVQRTLTAGLPADLINRETGRKHVFTAEEVAHLSLTPAEAEALAQDGLGNAA